MKTTPLFGLALLGFIIAACTSAPPPGLSAPTASDRAAATGDSDDDDDDIVGDDDDDDDDDDGSAGSGARSLPTAAPPPAGTVPPINPPMPPPTTTTTPPPTPAPATLKATLGKRLGDDDAQANSGTSVNQLQKLLLVHVPSRGVAASLSGGDLDRVKESIGSGDGMTITFASGAPDGMYALVDGNLYYPNTDLSLQPGMDLEHFPRGVVGYVNVTYYPNGSYGGTGASEIIWSGWEIGELAFGHAERLKSPLVVDLGGKGVTFEAPRPIFDVDGDGQRDRLAWVASNDTPFLVRDRNRNGRIDSIDEMFGDSTLDRNGATRTAKNGFEALAQHDADGNGVIDAKDPVFQELALWFDRNHDGITDDGELATLSAHQLRRIDLGYAATDLRLSFGNRIFQKSEATTTRGKVAVYDVWFRLD